jgi:hypothetical protein
MKRILLYILVGLVMACNKESDVDPATGTFIRYFGSENNNDAVLAIEAADGFVLLSNIEIQLSATEVVNKVKFTKTNTNGDYVSEAIYPDISNNEVGMKGASLIPISSGYLIVGEWIKGNTTELLLIRTNDSGALQDSVTISGKDIDPEKYANASLSGRAVIASDDFSSYVVLAEIKNSPDDMFVAQIDATNLTMTWNRKYQGNASNEVVNRLFSDNNRLFWSATVNTTADQTDIRIVEAPMNSESPISADPVLVIPGSNEEAKDFCRMIGGWAVIGSTNVSGNADIYLLRTSTSGAYISQQMNLAYGDDPINQTITDPELNDEGNSITIALDGNLVLLGTVETPNNQKELFLMKINAATNKGMWRRTYGGGDDEVGASVRALSDGSYLVFGTTYFGPRSKKLMLMKLKANGDL